MITFIYIFGRSCNQRLFSFSNVKPGSLLIDTSTIEPAVAQEMGELTQSKGATFLDAPVSGGRSCTQLTTCEITADKQVKEVDFM